MTKKKGKRKEKKINEKKGHSCCSAEKKNKKKRTTHSCLHTHIHAHMIFREVTHTLAGSPLFISALTEPHITTESAVTAFLPFVFFFSPSSTTDKKKKKKETFNRPVVVFPHSRNLVGFQSMSLICFFDFSFTKWSTEPPAPPALPPTQLSYKKYIQRVHIFSSFLQLADLARTSCPTSKTNKVRG